MNGNHSRLQELYSKKRELTKNLDTIVSEIYDVEYLIWKYETKMINR